MRGFIKKAGEGQGRAAAALLLLLLLTLLAAVFSFGVGFYSLSFQEVLGAVLAPLREEGGAFAGLAVPPQAVTVVWKIRLPRILSALLIGAALAVSGSAYQGMFRNPLVSPDILGVSAGASLGAAIAISGGFSYTLTQGFAFVGGFLAVALCYLISSRARYSQTLSLVLTGTMLGTLCTSAVTMLKYISDPNQTLPAITFWLMGSLAKVDMQSLRLSALPMAAGFIMMALMRWRLNLLALDDDEARSLGVNPRACRGVVIVASTLLSASAVCLGGLIGWVGLMIPHIARGLFGADYRRLLPACALLGALFLLVMDDLARALLAMELPLGVMTSFLGTPFFILLILRKKEG